ncbi:MAG: Gfo/Idh/MocA family oxidoreductase [Candidatus Eisenbacteria bacterium]|uniref:Gfo/Idh/MocA family oxidoreductase n=1 Tax=Eiseniibacteriota bacterium TaxID=2212470 RepID=A0A938BQN3_UNCEI|nr:Gfo/Idh/MocA family oxidoreductase [Candidatus Eisenbacteria bacterium]
MTKVAVIGVGYWGPNLVRNLVENPLCSEVVVCDSDTEKLERILRRYPSVRVTPEAAEVFAAPDIDGVMISTPPKTHFDLARMTLERGKHVFVEKPFTLSSRDGQELIDLARARGKVLMVGHTFEYSPPVRKIRQIVKSGELGQIFYLSSTRVNLGLHQKDSSVLWDLAPHDLSMFIYWLDETPTEVMATGKDFVQPGIPDVAFVFMRFGSGAIAHIQVSWLAPSKLRRTTVVGSAKMLVYDDTQNIEQVKIFDKGVSYQDPTTFGEYQLSYRMGDIVSPRLETYEPLQAEVTDFLESIIHGRRPAAAGEHGLRVVRVLEAAERSLSNSGHVEVLEPEPLAV